MIHFRYIYCIIIQSSTSFRQTIWSSLFCIIIWFDGKHFISYNGHNTEDMVMVVIINIKYSQWWKWSVSWHWLTWVLLRLSSSSSCCSIWLNYICNWHGNWGNWLLLSYLFNTNFECKKKTNEDDKMMQMMMTDVFLWLLMNLDDIINEWIWLYRLYRWGDWLIVSEGIYLNKTMGIC